MNTSQTVFGSSPQWMDSGLRSLDSLFLLSLFLFQCMVYSEVVTTTAPSLYPVPEEDEPIEVHLSEASDNPFDPELPTSLELTIGLDGYFMEPPVLVIDKSYNCDTSEEAYSRVDKLVSPLEEIEQEVWRAIVTFNAYDNSQVDGGACLSFRVRADGSSVGSVDYTVLVSDDDVPELTLSFSDDSPEEDVGSVTATITRNTDTTGSLGPVYLNLDDTAHESDFDLVPSGWPIDGTIPAGSDHVDITLNIYDDASFEGDEEIGLHAYMGSPTDFAQGEATLTIENNDPPPPSNTAPSFQSDTTFEVDEGDEFSELITATDAETSSADLTITITGGKDDEAFQFDSVNRELSLFGQDFEDPTDSEPGENTEPDGVYEVELTVEDEGGLTAVQIFTVTIVNKDPTIDNQTANIAEIFFHDGSELSADVTVATIGVGGDTIGTDYFELVPDNSVFKMVGNVLKIKQGTILNWEAFAGLPTLSVTVEVSDTDSPTTADDTALVTVTIVDINEAPGTISTTPSSLEVDWNASAETAIGTVSVFDPDNENGVGSQTHTFDITEDASGKFQVATDVNGVTTLKVGDTNLDDPNGESYSIKLRATDNGSPQLSSTEQAFTIVVDNPPIFSPAESYPYPEDRTTPIQLQASDPEGETVRFNLVEVGDHAKFNLTTAGSLTFKDQPDFENPTALVEPKNDYQLTVRASDSKHDVDRDFKVEVTNVNEAPQFDEDSYSFDENMLGPIDLDVSDEDFDDNADSLTFEIVDDDELDDGQFVLVNENTELHFEMAPDFEAPAAADDSNFYRLKLKVIDDEGLPSEVTEITVEVKDVDEPGSLIELSNDEIEENAGANFEIGTLSTNDPDNDPSNSSFYTYNYAIIAGSDRFNLDGNILRATSDFDYETEQSVSVTIEAEQSGGLGTEIGPQVFSIKITPVDEIPTISYSGSTSGPEDQNFFSESTVSVWDPETSAEGLAATASSGNQSMVKDENVNVTGDGADRNLTIVPEPDVNGDVTIYLNVSDNVNEVQTYEFQFTVNAVNDAPTFVAPLGKQTIEEDQLNGTGALSFMVWDVDDLIANLDVESSESTNPDLIPLDNISINETDANWTVTVIPVSDGFGSSNITLTASDDDDDSTDMVFEVEVTSVNDLPGITPISDQEIAEDGTTGILNFTLSDFESGPEELDVSRASSDIVRFPLDGVTLGGSGYDRTVTVQPVPNAYGTGTITLTVSDSNEGDQEMSFDVTVNPVNDPPTIGSMADRSMPANETFVFPGTVIVNDIDNASAELVVAVASSNPDLVSPGDVDIIGTEEERDLQISPQHQGYGETTITLTVDDGSASDETSFLLSVTPDGLRPADTDIETIPDYLEDVSGEGLFNVPPDLSDWQAEDSDLDTLDDLEEHTNGFNPNNPDSDGDGYSDNLELANHPPSAVDDTYTVEAGWSVPLVVLTNDSTSPDIGETLTITSVSMPTLTGANVSISASGNRLQYVSPGDESTGVDTLTYTVSDGNGGFDSATVIVDVVDTNVAPGFLPLPDIVMPANVSWNPFEFEVIDSDNQPSEIIVDWASDNSDLFPVGSLQFTGTDTERSFSLTPSKRAFGVAELTLVANDGSGSGVGRFSIQVGPHGLLPADTDDDGVPDYLEETLWDANYPPILITRSEAYYRLNTVTLLYHTLPRSLFVKDADAELLDPGNLSYAGGRLEISYIEGGLAGDKLGVVMSTEAPFTIQNTDELYFNSSRVGTISDHGDFPNPMQIDFISGMHLTEVRELLLAITFENLSSMVDHDLVVSATLVDGGGQSSDPALTIIHATGYNYPPEVYAGPDTELVLGAGATTIPLNGSVIDRDAVVDPVTGLPAFPVISWSQTAGSESAIIDDSSQLKTSVTFTAGGLYTFELSATHEQGFVTDEVNILVIDPSDLDFPPFVDAGADQTVIINTLVTLSGRTLDGFPSNDSVTAKLWEWVQIPEGSNAPTISNSDTDSPSFTPDALGVYIAKFSARNGGINPASDDVAITVVPDPSTLINSPPTVTIATPPPLTLAGSVSASTFLDATVIDDVMCRIISWVECQKWVWSWRRGIRIVSWVAGHGLSGLAELSRSGCDRVRVGGLERFRWVFLLESGLERDAVGERGDGRDLGLDLLQNGRVVRGC